MSHQEAAHAFNTAANILTVCLHSAAAEECIAFTAVKCDMSVGAKITVYDCPV